MLKQIRCIRSIKNNIRTFSKEIKNNNSAKIFEHFVKNGQAEQLNLFPNDLKRITTKREPTFYVADKIVADRITNILSRFHNKDVPFFEINPGPCILTESILKHLKPNTLGLIESNEEFIKIQKKLKRKHESKILLKTVKAFYVIIPNFIVENCQKRAWNEDIAFQLFCCLQSSDIYHFINDVVMQSRLFSNGRAEIFATMPTFEYMKLTAGPDSTYWLYTQKSCFFQILFEHEILDEIPRKSFLPWCNSKQAYGGKIEYDADIFYLVRIVPKKDLFSIYSPDDLPLLKFFILQCLFKRTGSIISKLEQWIPGIGIELITSKCNEPNNCEDASWRDLINSINVFTESGSLTPHQICALFKFIQKSPHYKTSCFHQQFQGYYALKNMKSSDEIVHSDEEEEPDPYNSMSNSPH